MKSHLNAQSQPIVDYFPTGCSTLKKNQAQLDNVCKVLFSPAVTDLRLHPNMFIIIYGYRASKEKKGIDLQRCKNARQYLLSIVKDKQFDIGKIQIKARGINETEKQVEYYLLPDEKRIREFWTKQ